MVLISSGGLGPDVGWILRLLSVPGAELVLPVIASKPVLTAGNKVRSWLRVAGTQSPRGGEAWSAYSSLSDPDTPQSFLKTLRSVVDYRGQAVSALNRLGLRTDLPVMAIWGERDNIIPSTTPTPPTMPAPTPDLSCCSMSVTSRKWRRPARWSS